MIIRGGAPRVIRGTAPAIPGGAVQLSDNTLQPFIFFEGRATVWLRIRNSGSTNALRVFFRRAAIEGIAPGSYREYIEIPDTTAATAGDPSFIEGLFELNDGEAGGGLYLMGNTTFEAILGLRAV
jgi:hypothetical protein